jgi:hypothetical protein
MIIDNSWIGLNTQDERFSYQDQREWLLTFGLGIIILQGVSSRKSLAEVNIMLLHRPKWCKIFLIVTDTCMMVLKMI